jgi:hypothetical protein
MAQNDDSTPPTMLVAVRIRPESEKERYNPMSKVVVQALTEKVIVFDPPSPTGIFSSSSSSFPSTHGTGGPPNNYRKSKDVRYAFHRVFDSSSTQEEVYEATAKTIIAEVLDGFNATVFAYGATGAGKTHTMIGNSEDPGVMVRTTRDLFDSVEDAREKGIECELTLSYLEIYNETIRDLLTNASSSSSISSELEGLSSGPSRTLPPALELREDSATGTVAVSGLSQHRPRTAEDVFELLARGNNNRRQSPTCANAVSSRSHAVLQIVVQQRDRGAGATNIVIRTGKVGKEDSFFPAFLLSLSLLLFLLPFRFHSCFLSLFLLPSSFSLSLSLTHSHTLSAHPHSFSPFSMIAFIN